MSDNPNDNEGLMEDVGLPRGAVADPDHPGWFSWGDFPRGSFAAATGRLLFKPDGPGRALCRMFPTDGHMNMGGSIHGGAVMSFIDMAMFAGGRCAGMHQGHYVTLDMTTRVLRPVTAASRCEARFLRKGRSIAHTESRLFDTEERLAAVASGTWRVLEPVDGERKK